MSNEQTPKLCEKIGIRWIGTSWVYVCKRGHEYNTREELEAHLEKEG